MRRLALAVATGAVALLGAGCMPQPVTEQAQAVSNLWVQFFVAAVLVGGTVWFLITFMILRYRHRGPDPAAIPKHGAPVESKKIEALWTAIPIVIVLILFALTLGAMSVVDARAQSRVRIDVTAFRWQWRFDYEGTNVRVLGDSNQAAPQMVVPVGEPIHIVLTSVDVDHSFYVPQFLFKRDAIPGHPNEFDVTITEPGTYNGQCAEFCGVFHDRMLLSVKAVTRPEYDAWLAAAAAAAPSAAPAAQPSGSLPSGASSSGGPSLPPPSAASSGPGQAGASGSAAP